MWFDEAGWFVTGLPFFKAPYGFMALGIFYMAGDKEFWLRVCPFTVD